MEELTHVAIDFVKVSFFVMILEGGSMLNMILEGGCEERT